MATFSNSATLSYHGNVTSSNVVTGEIVEVLSATKTPVRGSYRPGQRGSYVLSIVNSGPTAINGLTVTDDLGAYPFGTGTGTVTPLTYEADSVLYYANGLLQATPTVTGTDPLTITGISVPAGGNASIIYEATANEFAPLGAGGTLTNTATLTGAGLVNPVEAAATVTADETPDLAINKSLSPATVTENGRITYTFTIQNRGATAAEAGDDLVLTDTFDPRLSDLTVTYNGTAWTTPANYTYDETTGLFTTVAGQLTVPAAAFTQDAATGAWTTAPGTGTLVVSGTV